MDELIGKVVRLHREWEPQKHKFYLITEGDTSYFNGVVNIETVRAWIESGLELTFYQEIN